MNIDLNKKIKTNWKPSTMIYPVPAAIISCGTTPKEYNLITIAWIGTICSEPPMLSISVRPERYSHGIIKKNKEFVVNLTNKNLLKAADYCGIKSGKKVNKWNHLNLAPYTSTKIKTPQIANSPLSIECSVKQIISLGSHDMFIAEIESLSVLNQYIDKKGALKLSIANLISYIHGGYYSRSKLEKRLGFSVAKKKKRKNSYRASTKK